MSENKRAKAMAWRERQRDLQHGSGGRRRDREKWLANVSHEAAKVRAMGRLATVGSLDSAPVGSTATAGGEVWVKATTGNWVSPANGRSATSSALHSTGVTGLFEAGR